MNFASCLVGAPGRLGSPSSSSLLPTAATTGVTAQSPWRAFPPSLGASLCLLPWLRMLLRFEGHLVRQWILGPLVEKAKHYWEDELQLRRQQRALGRNQPQPRRPLSLRLQGDFNVAPLQQQGQTPDPLRVVQTQYLYTRWWPVRFNGTNENVLFDADAQVHPPPLGTVAEIYVRRTSRSGADQDSEAGKQVHFERDLYFTPDSVVGHIVTVLSTPFAAAATGWLLRGVALWLKADNWLEKMLAISSFRREASASAAATTAMYRGVPSLHWCNVVGLTVWTVASNAASLAYRYGRLRRRTRATVETRPFQWTIIDGLKVPVDLIGVE